MRLEKDPVFSAAHVVQLAAMAATETIASRDGHLCQISL
jgi:hypothetical protein